MGLELVLVYLSVYDAMILVTLVLLFSPNILMSLVVFLTSSTILFSPVGFKYLCILLSSNVLFVFPSTQI